MKNIRVNKKAQSGGSNWFMISLLAAIAVLVIVFFYLWQSGNLAGWFDITQRGDINLPQRVQTCQFSCTSGSYTDYCIIKREVVFNEDKNDERNGKLYTCPQLEEEPEAGLSSCPNINCASVEVQCEDLDQSECISEDNKESCEWKSGKCVEKS